jgi:hypothetical protein
MRQMHQRASRYSLKLARRICGRLAAGQSQARIGRTPGMPSASTIRVWLGAHPEFARMYRAACARRAEGAARANRHDPGRPGQPSRYTPEKARAICALVAQGLSLRAIARRAGAPCLATICNWQSEHEEFRRMYLAAWEQHAQLISEETIEIADEALGKGWAGPAGRPAVSARDALLHARLKIDARNHRVARLAPKIPGSKTPEAKPELTHEEWLDLLG